MQDFNFSVVLNAPQGEFGLLRARGADAAVFLQGQLTQDVLSLKQQELRLAAWCSAKGRVLASFWLWRAQADEYYLLCSRDVAAAMLKRLKMFVLRAKCELADVSEIFEVRGRVEPIQNAMDLGAAPAVSTREIAQKGIENLAFFEFLLPPASLDGHSYRRQLEIRAVEPNPAPVESGRVVDPHLANWRLLEAASGVARVGAQVSDAFVPQMLNFESIGGVNFKKGCYPGQEVVARSQFRGVIKRRTYLVRSERALQAGQSLSLAVQDAADEQEAGLVAFAASNADGKQHLALICIQTAFAGQALVVQGQSCAMEFLALPYPLLTDI